MSKRINAASKTTFVPIVSVYRRRLFSPNYIHCWRGPTRKGKGRRLAFMRQLFSFRNTMDACNCSQFK